MGTVEDSPRLLFLLPFPPRVDADHGGARAIAEILIHIPERYRIAALYLSGPLDEPPSPEVRDRCSALEGVDRPGGARTLGGRLARGARFLRGLTVGRPTWVSRWWVPEFEVRARELARNWDPDLVQAEFSIMGAYLPQTGGPKARKVVTVHEPGVRAAEDLWYRSHGIHRLATSMELRAWTSFERELIASVDAAVTFTEPDRATLSSLVGQSGRDKLFRIPIGVSISPSPPGNGDRAPVLLFVGNFHHPPNVDGALRLAASIFPTVRGAVPDAELRLVGRNPTPAMLRAQGNGVQVLGYVPDLREQLDAASLVMAPLRMGGGMRVKVLEALAHGKAVIGTRLAASGLDVRDGEHLLLAETDQELAAAAIELLSNRDRAKRIGLAGRAWAEDHARWQITARGYDTLYRRLLGG